MSKNKIPKVIHYCWFGKGRKPELALKCIDSWKKKCPDYDVIEWNEDNFNITDCPIYVKQAYDQKKWAFVSDYARLKIVHEYGGIYLDTDVQLIKSLNQLLKYDAFFAKESSEFVATGLGFGSIKGLKLLLDLMNDYENIMFIQENGNYDLTPCPTRNAHVFYDYGVSLINEFQIINNNIAIFPTIYMCPIDYRTLRHRYSFKTISVHWFAASWRTEKEKESHKAAIIQRRKEKFDEFLHIPNKLVKNLLGDETYNQLKKKVKNITKK